MRELSGKVAVVTGASRGIGKQIAIALAERGADVVVAARTVEPRKRLPGTVGETVAAVEALGRKAVAVATDVARVEDLQRLVNSAMAEFGRVDIFVNNAAYTAGKAWGAALADVTLEDWRAQYATNLEAPLFTMQQLVPIMRSQGGGLIINLSSGSSQMEETEVSDRPDSQITGNPPLAYASSKAALNRLVNVLAPAVRKDRIAVVALDPGFVRTEMVELMVDGGFDASRSIPMSIPAGAVVHIATSSDPMQFSGRFLRAADLV